MAAPSRAFCLDALRGYAIITMVLSGQMVFIHLPAWMAHAQVPPGKSFDSTIYGITWVDLVFPFFLFAMGAALPFSVGRKIEKVEPRWKIMRDILLRGAMLVYFAIFFQHMKPFVIGDTTQVFPNIMSLVGFVWMFAMFKDFRIKDIPNRKLQTFIKWAIKLIAFISGWSLLNYLYFEGKDSPVFDPGFSDIIIIVLANMAFFGGIIYTLTHNKPIHRIAILPFVIAFFLASQNEGWVREVFNLSPFPWAYKFYYLKYLFIVIPGTLAGEYLRDWMKAKELESSPKESSKKIPALLVLIALLIITANVVLLFNRQLTLNLIVSLLLMSLGLLIVHKRKSTDALFWRRLFAAGSYCLALGLVLEAYQGGIRKDDSTYSYYFVTAGLAFMALMFFNIICDYFKVTRTTGFLIMTGQNPMIAYVSVALVIYPLLNLTGLSRFMIVFQTNAWMGFLQGIILTSLAVLITVFFTKRKWFWKT